MKAKYSILQQLLLNILLPVLGIFIVVFFVVFQYSKQQLQNELKDQKKNILEETRNLISYFDFSMRTHEQAYIQEMQQAAYTIQKEIGTTNQLSSIDLFALSKKIGLDTSTQHIYLINRKLQIVNTTFAPDLGLDFAKMNTSYYPFFDAIFKANTFREDRFGLEVNTGKIKKYAFLPTVTKNAIIELGFYSKEADNYRKLLLSKITSLSRRYKGIEKVELYLGVKGIPDVKMKDKLLIKAYLKCLDEKQNQSIEYKSKRKELFFLPVLDAKLYTGYLLEIDQNDSQEKILATTLFNRFAILLILTLIIITTLVIWRSRKITQPIILLSEKTRAINATNLNQHFTITGNKELEILSTSFNDMMDQLKISYDGLEEKVRERTAELMQQKSIVEQKNKEVHESISYAQFIQQALLPNEQELHYRFPQSFLIFEPKDIVAGDFYWLEHHQNHTWIAVADCTGHGVPGAMMSVLCINALNQTILELENPSPGALLDSVREKVVQTLNKQAKSVKDGMDISILKFNHDTHEMWWTGANNPLWIVRDNDVLAINADKQPIGQFDDAFPFTTHSIQLKENDLLVLFSDGYADQFGGPKNKKFKYATFKEWLIRTNELDVIEQRKVLLEQFVLWKGDEEQTDDVCVIGIRVNEIKRAN